MYLFTKNNTPFMQHQSVPGVRLHTRETFGEDHVVMYLTLTVAESDPSVALLGSGYTFMINFANIGLLQCI